MRKSKSITSSNQSKDFIKEFARNQTYLLKGFLKDKGGEGVSEFKTCYCASWCEEINDSIKWLDQQSESLILTYNSLLEEPRPFNLKKIDAPGRAGRIAWRMANAKGNHVSVQIFTEEANEDTLRTLKALPDPIVNMLKTIDLWREVINTLYSILNSNLKAIQHLQEKIS